jgi:DNA relaxase NicK
LDIFVGFDPDPIITAAFEIACDVRDAVTFGFKRKVRLIDSGGDGNTLYLGARTSQVFCRMYNKGRESGEDRYSGVLRAEVQFNGATAGTALKSLAACGYRASAMCATVLAAFGKAGVELQAGEQGEGPIGWSVEAPSPDVVKQVRWLREQVGPTARRVEQVYGRGSVASLLGLNDDA